MVWADNRRMRLRIVPARLASSPSVNHVNWAPQAVLRMSAGTALAVARSPVGESLPTAAACCNGSPAGRSPQCRPRGGRTPLGARPQPWDGRGRHPGDREPLVNALLSDDTGNQHVGRVVLLCQGQAEAERVKRSKAVCTRQAPLVGLVWTSICGTEQVITAETSERTMDYSPHRRTFRGFTW